MVLSSRRPQVEVIWECAHCSEKKIFKLFFIMSIFVVCNNMRNRNASESKISFFVSFIFHCKGMQTFALDFIYAESISLTRAVWLTRSKRMAFQPNCWEVTVFALATVSPLEPEQWIKQFPLGAGSAVSHFHSQAKRKRARDGWGGGRR